MARSSDPIERTKTMSIWRRNWPFGYRTLTRISFLAAGTRVEFLGISRARVAANPCQDGRPCPDDILAYGLDMQSECLSLRPNDRFRAPYRHQTREGALPVCPPRVQTGPAAARPSSSPAGPRISQRESCRAMSESRSTPHHRCGLGSRGNPESDQREVENRRGWPPTAKPSLFSAVFPRTQRKFSATRSLQTPAGCSLVIQAGACSGPWRLIPCPRKRAFKLRLRSGRLGQRLADEIRARGRAS